MLDSKLLRTATEQVAQGLAKRGYELDVAKIQTLEEIRKAIQVKTENLQSERNSISKGIGKAKQAGEDVAPMMQAVENIKQELVGAEAELAKVQAEWDDFVNAIPNVPADEVPAGKSEEDNVEVRRWGIPRDFHFPIKDHVDLGAELGGLDFEVATKITATRFAVLRGGVA